MGFLCDLPQHKTRAKKKHLNNSTSNISSNNYCYNNINNNNNNEDICKSFATFNSITNNSNNQINPFYKQILARNRLSDINLSNNFSYNNLNNSNNSNEKLSNFNQFYTKNYEHDVNTSETIADAATTNLVELNQQHLTVPTTTTTTTSINNNNNSSFIIIRHTLCFYAISSIILALCVFTTPIAATSEVDHEIFAEGKSDKEILDILLKNSRYDKRLLPPVHGTLTVNVSVLLLSLASPDESSLKYEVEFLLQQQWYDPRLIYKNETNYDFLNAIHHHEDIWLPDTYFIMHGDFKDPIIPMHFALRIYRNGTINYLMRRHLILSCQGRLNIFPFDDPLCSFAMESISYEQHAITYVWKNDEDTLRKSPSLTTLNAYLIQNQTITCPIKAIWRADGLTRDDEDFLCSLCQKRFETQGNYSCLKVDLIFTRDRAFYFTTVFIPGIILVTSSFITFWLEWNAVPARSMIGNYSCLKVDLTFTRDRAFYFTTVFIPGVILVTSSFITFWLEWNAVPARVMIGVTTMLNFFTTSNGFRSTLPVVSNLTAMNVWDGVCMCFIYASLLEFVCVNYVGRKRPLHNVVYRPGENPVTQRLPAVLSRIGVILASPLEVIESEFLTAMSSEKSAISPTQPPPHTTTIPPAPSSSYGAEQSMMHIKPYYNMPELTSPTIKSDETLKTLSSSPSEAATPSGTISSRDTIKIQISDNRIDGGADDDTDQENNLDESPPIKPPRRRSSRSTSHERSSSAHILSEKEKQRIELDKLLNEVQTEIFKLGDKKRDTGGPNEIVACTSCGSGTSPCTHSANNGCATETCFVQVRKKEPPHPIRVAKTIDVIARITFPTAYSIFLIFFFIHYKGFS